MGISGGIIIVVLIVNTIVPYIAYCSVPSVMQTNSFTFKCCWIAYAILNTLQFVILFLYYIFSLTYEYNMLRTFDWIAPFVYIAIFVMQLVLVSMASFDELCDENFVQVDLAGG